MRRNWSTARPRRRAWPNGSPASARAAPARPLKQRIAGAPKVEALLLGLADGSPYLWELASAEPDRLLAVLEADPGERLAELLAKSGKAAAAAKDEAAAMRLLRRMKAEAALLIALADIGGVWPVMQAARALTEVADTAIVAAVRFLLREPVARGKLKPADRQAPEQGSGHIVLAMGKMGAFELNYSSDIDLIVFYDPDAPALADKDEAAAFHVRITRGLVKLLQERTADGYVFRVDLRLRPDPASTQVAVSTETALNYYGSVGQNWERAAMIKARVCAGDAKAGEDILRQLSPFIWRKYLDFAAVADIEALKRQIHAYRGHADIAVEGHNIKLGRGGIREIEFFAQTQQLVAGGRHPELRGRETLPTLAALAEGGWIGADARADLEAAYLFLRETEHRLQMVADDQTHTLPSDREGLERFARFAGFKDRDAFAETLLGHLRKVQGHYVRLFEETCGRGQPAGADVSQGQRRPRDAQPARRDGLPAAARDLLDGPQLAVRLLQGAAQRVGTQPVRRSGAGAARPPGQIGKSRQRDLGVRRFHRRHEPRRAAVLAAAAEPGPGDAGGADARHRAASRRHSGAASRGDGRAARALVFRRAAGRGRARRRSRPHRRAGARHRGLSRPAAHVQPGADVPDRRAHPVGHGVGRAGGRRVRPDRRRCRAGAASPRRSACLPKTTAASAASRPRCWRSASSAAAR